MTLRKFTEYVREGIVKKQTLKKQRALSLIKESEEKKNFLEMLQKSIPKEKMNANFIVDYCYDIIIEIIRAKMFFDGYNPGNSHEAEVSYMLALGFSETETRFMDEIRYYRNGIKYYGTILNMEYAKKVLEFTNKIYPKLKEMIQ